MADGVSAVKPFDIHRTVLLLTGIWCTVLLGCGIKGPPVPPRTPPVPAVENLAYQLEGRTLTLTWRLSKPLSKADAKRSTFGVYQSTTAADQPVCQSCPLIFEKVISLAYIDSDDNRYSTDVFFDPGYRYVFKVRLEMDGRAGSDSNLVRVNDHFDNAPDGANGQMQSQ